MMGGGGGSSNPPQNYWGLQAIFYRNYANVGGLRHPESISEVPTFHKPHTLLQTRVPITIDHTHILASPIMACYCPVCSCTALSFLRCIYYFMVQVENRGFGSIWTGVIVGCAPLTVVLTSPIIGYFVSTGSSPPPPPPTPLLHLHSPYLVTVFSSLSSYHISEPGSPQHQGYCSLVVHISYWGNTM